VRTRRVLDRNSIFRTKVRRVLQLAAVFRALRPHGLDLII